MKPYYWTQVHAHPKSATHDTHKLNARDCIVMMPTHCYSDACQQGRIACPTQQACRLADGDSFDDAPRRDWTVAWGVAAIALTLGWALFLVWVVART